MFSDRGHDARFPLRQVRAVIAVCEEGSFTRAAERENATQSGISQHVAAVERDLKAKLFTRTGGRVTPTPAGLRYYKRCVEAVGTLELAGEEARALAGEVTGDLRIGLMPTFTRAVLAPVLDDFVPRYPEVRLHIVEGYSNLLTDMVLDDALDFAIVPAFEGAMGLKSRLLVRDREMLISGPASRPDGTGTGAPCRLQAAQDRGAGPEQYPPAQPRHLFPDARRRDRGHAGDGRDDRHAGIRRALRLGDGAAERDLGQRHRPRRVDRQSARGARAARRIRGDPADAAHALDAGALFLQRFEAEVAHIHEVWDAAIKGTKKGKLRATN